jgi:hypothetical protein
MKPESLSIAALSLLCSPSLAVLTGGKSTRVMRQVSASRPAAATHQTNVTSHLITTLELAQKPSYSAQPLIPPPSPPPA